MSKAKKKFRRPLTVLFSSVCCAAVALPLLAVAGADPVPTGSASVSARPNSALVNLIVKLRDSGALQLEEAAGLIKMAEADAADARVQVALTALAAAQAEAAQARAESAMAQAAAAKSVPVTVPSVSVVASPVIVEPVAAVVPVVAPVAPSPEPVAVPIEVANRVVAVVEDAPVARPAPAAPAAPSPKELVQEDDSVRVTYVPEIVKDQLRQEIKNDVLEQARRERWATPRAVPDWVSRFTLFGDMRVRYESISYPKTNDSISASFPNFNAINTGSPLDTAGALGSPQYNVDQSRRRIRLRARLGAAIDLGEDFSAGFRMATGENNSPVSQNQTFGAAGSGQGGNFSKYALWVDRAFLKYEFGKATENVLALAVGRMDNPFFSTSILWADDLGFDGGTVTIPMQIHWDGTTSKKIRPYFVLGAFPVFNTDLNFASNTTPKYKSYDKWLYAGQFVINADLTKDISIKVGYAYYLFDNVRGRVSTPYVPVSNQDSGSTDQTRPAFAQKGNTYRELRSLLPDPTYNANGTTNLWQYYGLITDFHNSAATARIDYNHFLPFQVSFLAEWTKNTALDKNKYRERFYDGTKNQWYNTIAVNNYDTSGAFEGGDKAWITTLKIGTVALQKRWDWALSVGYRKVESDAVIDGFCDSDFGGGGTNVKGYTLTGALALSKRVALGARLMSSREVIGAPFKSETVQIDLNAKF